MRITVKIHHFIHTGVRYRDVLLIVTSAAMISLIATPFINQYGSFISLDGSVGAIDHMDLWSSSDPFTAFVYIVGDIFCPQIQSRSFILNGSQMGFCMRDVSILAGLIIGFLFSYTEIFSKFTLKKSCILALCAFALLMADWGIQHIMSADIGITRILTGLFLGFSVSCIISSYEDLIHRMRWHRYGRTGRIEEQRIRTQ